jgi:hypothetical protein
MDIAYPDSDNLCNNEMFSEVKSLLPDDNKDDEENEEVCFNSLFNYYQRS